MDARNLTPALCAVILLLGGCLEPGMGPTLRQPEAKPAQSKPETEVVQSDPKAPPAQATDAAGPAADESALVGERVRSYIEQVDTISQRARRDWLTTSQTNNASAHPQRLKRYASTPLSLPPVERAETQVERTDARPPRPETTVTPVAALTPTSTAPAAPADSADPPVLAAVTAREQAAVAVPEIAGSAETPSPNAPAVARHAPISLAQFLKQWTGDPDDSSFRQQLDLRILRAIAGDHEAAREPFSVVSAEQQAMGSRLIDSLIAIRQAHDGDPTEAITDVLASIDGLRDSLRPLSELRIPTVALCRQVRGFGDYVPIEPPSFPAGTAAEFVLYCEVQNFISQPEDDNLYHARFEMRTTILDRAGDSVLEIRDADIVDSCRNRRNDCFIPRLVRLPATLSPGEYVAKVTVIDKLGDKLAENRASFRVVAR
jgi:hypothetical protein